MALQRIGIDVENGDSVKGESVTERMVPAIRRFSQERSDVKLYLHGHEGRIDRAFQGNIPAQATIVPASEFYTPDQIITRPVEGTVLNNLLGAADNGTIEGIFTLLDTAKVARETLKSRVRGAKPALVGIFPSREGDYVFSDIGFGSQTSKMRLYSDVVNNWARTICAQGIMASVYMQGRGIKRPRMGILSIGTESHKGSDVDKRLESLIQQGIAENGLGELVNYIGKIEPEDCFMGMTDVALTDGRAGNLILKTAEQSAKLLEYWKMEEVANLSKIDEIRLALGKGVLGRMKRNILDKANPDRYGGAIALGYKGIIVKGHGAASPDAIYYGLHTLADCTHEDSGAELVDTVKRYMPKK